MRSLGPTPREATPALLLEWPRPPKALEKNPQAATETQHSQKQISSSPGKAGISGLHFRLPRGVRPSLEGKQRIPLSSQVATQISWSPLSGLKGVRPSLQFGERTRDCALGQAGKEGAHLARMGASQGFPRAAAPVGVFHEAHPLDTVQQHTHSTTTHTLYNHTHTHLTL